MSIDSKSFPKIPVLEPLKYVPVDQWGNMAPDSLGHKVDELVATVNVLLAEIEVLKTKNEINDLNIEKLVNKCNELTCSLRTHQRIKPSEVKRYNRTNMPEGY